MPHLRERSLAPEEMDRPDLPADQHHAALDGLARLNRWSRSDRILWRPIRWLAFHHPRLRVLDIACGAGDLLGDLARRGHHAGLQLDFLGVDISPTAIEHARRRTAGWTVQFEQRDALVDPLPAGFDVVVCSLFLHHLTDNQAVELLRRMAAAARRLVLINDLRRSRAGWVLATTACRLLTRSPIVHADGPLSVARAFTPAEALRIADRAGLQGATVSRRWPFRFLLTWHRAAQ